MQILFVMLLTLIAFLTIILLLASKPKYSAKLTRTCIVIAGIGAIFFYGYGFAVTTDNFGLAFIRALLAVCGIYMGRSDLASISAAPLMQHTWAQWLFWFVHFLALYATTSAAITIVGAEALRKLRLWLVRRGPLHLIYGVSDDTLDLGKYILKHKQGSVVFVDTQADSANATAIAQAGCVLRSDDGALQADSAFVRSIGAHRKGRTIHVYALERLDSDNLRYARRLRNTLQARHIAPEQTSLVIRASEDAEAASLQVLGTHYGYGTVTTVQDAALAARTLIRNFPPCNYMEFDPNGTATDDFEALIVGFGQIGQSVLRHLVMNGQFAGSNFRATVFAPDCNCVKGYFSRRYPQVLNHYDIRFQPFDARSEYFYDYLIQRGNHLKYIALCTGSETANLEIAENLTDYLWSAGLTIPVFLCSHRGIRHFHASEQSGALLSLYRPEVLSMEQMDKLAMLVNSRYQQDAGKTPWEHWLCCDHFNRMSCRAAADFMPAMLRMAGLTEERVRSNGWNLSEVQLENLGKAEHLRWCAFLFCMGYAPMTQEEYDSRAARYLQQIAAGEEPLRISKNTNARTHACLIDWDALDALSRKESELTGKPVDYKSLDMENVHLIPELLKVSRKAVV